MAGMQAALEALKDSGLSPDAITHVLTATCHSGLSLLPEHSLYHQQ